MKIDIFTDLPFSPKLGVKERYSLEYEAKRRGISIDELKLEIQNFENHKQNLIEKLIAKGYTQEQAENEVYRCL